MTGAPAGGEDAESWAALAQRCCDLGGPIAGQRVEEELSAAVAEEYRATFASPELVEFDHGAARYLFDLNRDRAERTVLAVARPQQTPALDRDANYQRGYPLPQVLAGRALDRGHLVPHTAGGLFGPNMFTQDRALNRGWSADGRAYRALERVAVAASPNSMYAIRPMYVDDTDIPEFLDVALFGAAQVTVQRFRNRFDTVPASGPARLRAYLRGATDAHIGALGEETAAVLLEDSCDATIVAMGDAAMPRQDGRQDIDVLALVDGSLVAYEVKSRYLSRLAGRYTRTGNLLRPRLRARNATGRPRQGSQAYVAARLSDHLDVSTDFEGVDVRVIVVDFRELVAQQFAVSDDARTLRPLERPADCRDAADRALTRILDHRGYL